MIEILIGIVSGIIGGLGMGGGTVLILFLSLFLDIEQHIAQATNIVFFVPTAISAIIVSIKNKNIHFKIAFTICLWGILGAFVGSYISLKMDVNLLRKCFGVFLIFIAVYQTYEYIKEKKRHNNTKNKKEA